MRIHFIGIGGIGVSALARYYLQLGHKISGSDLVSSEITDSLKKDGAKIAVGKHKNENLPKNTGMVIYSAAIKPNNAELIKAKHYGLKTKTYSQSLGELTKKYFTIAVSGTHGKSTTSSMLGLILIKAGLDPTIIIGTKLKELKNSNCRVGKNQYLVIEADEHFASFLNHWPKIIVLTNIEREHLDYYKNLSNIKKAFKKFISHLPKNGVLITKKLIKQRDIRKIKKILKIPGDHNVYNAALALNAARALKIPDKVSLKALSEYKGAWRRFEITKTLYPKPLTLISDYAHHPTEVKVTLKAAREKYPKKKIWCVFQPHQYQRTHYLFRDFVKVFKQAPVHKLIITDIYDVAGREENKIRQKISAEKLIKRINKKLAIYLPNDRIIKYLKNNLQGKEVVIIMGAGDIYKIWKEFSTARQ